MLVKYLRTCTSVNCTLSSTNTKSFFFAPTEREEILKIISLLKNKNSVGVVGIPTKLIKAVSENILNPLVYIINVSFEQGQFPSLLKIASVFPIYKNKGDPNSVDNYRRITILNVLSKIFERLIYNRLTTFLINQNIPSDCQHGFNMNRSTETAAYQLMEYIYKNIDQGQLVAGVFFDLSKASALY